MATVTSQLTRVTDADAGTWVSTGGGAGGASNTDIFIQGLGSFGRRGSNVTDHGFLFDNATGIDLSAAGLHVGFWLWHTHYSKITAAKFQLGADTTNFDRHHFDVNKYPPTGGFIRVWANLGRTPDSTGGTGLNKSSTRYFGCAWSCPSVGGNVANEILDAIDYTSAGLLLTGTAGVFSDFVAADEGDDTNKYGVVTTKDGVIYCLARLTLGSATSLAFADTGFALIFADQDLVASNFMGVTVDLQNASTTVDWSNAVVRSAGSVKGDIIVTGTSGQLNIINSTLASLRTIVLTSACSVDSTLISACGQIVAAGANVRSCNIVDSTATAALLWNVNTDTSTKLDDTNFTSTGTGHALEFGPNTPSSISLIRVGFSGYGADDTTDATIYNNSEKEVTISIADGDTPTIRNGTNASTILILDVRTFSFSVLDVAGTPITGYEWRLYEASGTPGVLGTVELAGEESATLSSQSYIYEYDVDTDIVLQVIHNDYLESITRDTLENANKSIIIRLIKEENI